MNRACRHARTPFTGCCFVAGALYAPAGSVDASICFYEFEVFLGFPTHRHPLPAIKSPAYQTAPDKSGLPPRTNPVHGVWFYSQSSGGRGHHSDSSLQGSCGPPVSPIYETQNREFSVAIPPPAIARTSFHTAALPGSGSTRRGSDCGALCDSRSLLVLEGLRATDARCSRHSRRLASVHLG
jgi:hypothetical protein